MKKTILSLLVLSQIFWLTSCDVVPNVSVNEELSKEQLANIAKKNPEFTYLYLGIRLISESMSEVDKIKYNELTYRHVNEYIEFRDNEDYWVKYAESLHDEWKNEMGRKSVKVDSIIDYWKTFMKENSLDSYVKIEFVELNKTYYDYINSLKDVYFGFRITPLKGEIQQMKFRYAYVPKIEDKGDESVYSSPENCILLHPVSEPKVFYYEVDYFDRDKFEYLSTSDFIRDYNIKVDITDVRIGDKNLDFISQGMPQMLYLYLTDNDADLTYSEVATNLLGEEYLSEDDYFISQKKTKLFEFDELSFEFLSSFDF